MSASLMEETEPCLQEPHQMEATEPVLGQLQSNVTGMPKKVSFVGCKPTLQGSD